MAQVKHEPGWYTTSIKPRIPLISKLVRPAEVTDGLCRAMLDRKHLLEDAQYNKVVPNRFVVELGEENYQRNFRPLESNLLRQWQNKLRECLITANIRLGRKEYRFGGPIIIEIRPVTALGSDQVNILSRIQPDASPTGQVRPISRPAEPTIFLEIEGGSQRWPLSPGITTLGRDSSCDIPLDMPEVREKRLVSSKHAYLRCDDQGCMLYDGSPDGKPSLNGTFLNAQRVPENGQLLRHGDQIILAALDPLHPQPDTPGVVTLRFYDHHR